MIQHQFISDKTWNSSVNTMMRQLEHLGTAARGYFSGNSLTFGTQGSHVRRYGMQAPGDFRVFPCHDFEVYLKPGKRA